MATTRADKRTQTEAPLIYYSDIDINFSRNPVTGNLVRVTNEEAVKSAMRNLILTSLGESPYEPFKGSKVNAMLFEFGGDSVAQDARKVIEQAVTAYEKRVKLISVDVFDDTANFNIIINIIFEVVNIVEPISLQVVVRRVR